MNAFACYNSCEDKHDKHFNLKSYPKIVIATVVKGHQLSGCDRKSIIWLAIAHVM